MRARCARIGVDSGYRGEGASGVLQGRGPRYPDEDTIDEWRAHLGVAGLTATPIERVIYGELGSDTRDRTGSAINPRSSLKRMLPETYVSVCTLLSLRFR